jgi:hypothetical protein
MLILSLSLFAQEKQEKETKNWTKSGAIGLTLAQASFSNWIKGGENSVAANALLNYNFNYKKGKNVWDNKIIMAYGLSEISGVTKKTDDRFELNSVYGYEAGNNWYYSAFANFKTQFTDGYDYSTSPKTVTSKAFAPAYLNFGPGMLWKKSDNLYINFAPATTKMTFVTDTALSNAGAYGVDPGETYRYEIGMAVNGYYKFEAMKNISVENILGLYSNYLNNPQNIDVSYQMNMVMKVNKYVSANLGLHFLYDDDALKDMQFKEVFGLGFNAVF